MVKTEHPQSYFWLNVAPPADASEMGKALAEEATRIYKRDFPSPDWRDAYAYLVPWNKRHGSPFTDDQIRAMSELPPADRAPRKKRVKPDLTNTLFGDISKI